MASGFSLTTEIAQGIEVFKFRPSSKVNFRRPGWAEPGRRGAEINVH